MNDNSIEFYDIVIGIDSLLSLKDGWEIKYSEAGYENYLNQKDKRSCIVGVIGNGNKGKSFILQKISDSKLISGYSVKTEGLSLLYPTNIKRNIICLDTAGQETPLKDPDRNTLFVNKSEEEVLEILSEKARDRQLIELFLQSFVIQESNILIAVVGQLTNSDQKLLNRIKKESKQQNKLLFIVHNLNTLVYQKEIVDYIENVLEKSLTFKLSKTNFINLTEDKETKEEKNTIFYTEEDCYNQTEEEEDDEGPSNTVVHLVIAFEDSEAGNYYNQPVYDYLKQQLTCQSNLKQFPVVEKVVNHLTRISKTIMEDPLKIKKISKSTRRLSK